MVVEPLDALKSQIREVTLTLRDGQAPPDLPGEILAVRRRPRQWQALVRGAGEKDLSALGGHGAVREIEVRAPNLEEIFVAYIERGRTASGGGASNDGVSQQTEVPTP